MNREEQVGLARKRLLSFMMDTNRNTGELVFPIMIQNWLMDFVQSEIDKAREEGYGEGYEACNYRLTDPNQTYPKAVQDILDDEREEAKRDVVEEMLEKYGDYSKIIERLDGVDVMMLNYHLTQYLSENKESNISKGGDGIR